MCGKSSECTDPPRVAIGPSHLSFGLTSSVFEMPTNNGRAVEDGPHAGTEESDRGQNEPGTEHGGDQPDSRRIPL